MVRAARGYTYCIQYEILLWHGAFDLSQQGNLIFVVEIHIRN